METKKNTLFLILAALMLFPFEPAEALVINPYYANPELQLYRISIDNGVKVTGPDWSATFKPSFNLNNGYSITWDAIPPNIGKRLWKTQTDETHWKYGVDFSYLTVGQKNSVMNVTLRLVGSENLTWSDVRLDSSCIIVKEKVSICHDDILASYTIPLINRTDVVIGNLTGNWIGNPDGTFNISFDPTITITSEAVMTTSILVNVTKEAGNSDSTNFTHLNVSTAAPYDSLLIYLPFDGDKPNYPTFKAYDFSGGNRDGTAVNDTYVDSINCVYGSCAKFDGNQTVGNRDYIDLTGLSITGNYNITMMAWINPHNAQYSTTDSRIFASGTECLLRFVTVTDRVDFILNSFTTNDRVNSLTNTVKPEVWTHIAGVYNGTSLIIYINGTQNNQSAAPTGSYGACTAWQIGFGGTSGGYYNGSIDELMFFNDSLTSVQVLAIYNNQSARFFPQGTQDTQEISMCYQETANVSTSCGGLNTGEYRTDDYYFYVNYTKPAGFTSAVWKVKHGNTGNYTVAIPSSCFNDIVQLRFMSADDPALTFASSSRGECRSSTGWGIIAPLISGDNGTWSAGGLDYPYDGDWGTAGEFNEDSTLWGTGVNSMGLIYEEGIYWVTGGIMPDEDNENGFAGMNRVNVSTTFSALHGSSVNLTVGYYDGSWHATTPQLIVNATNSTFTITDTTTKLTLNYTLYAGNSTNPFYSPLVIGNITLTSWYEEEEAPPAADTTQPNIYYTSPTGISGSTLKINITSNDTQSNISVFTDINGDLLLWLRMDGLNASGGIADNSSYKTDCNATGGQQVTGGALGKAWKPINIAPLTVDQDAIDCGNPTRFNVTNKLTLSGWFNISGSYSSNTQSGIRRVDSFVLPYIDSGYTYISGWIKNSTNWYSVTATTAPATVQGKWMHLALTYDGNLMSIYVNGKLENTTALSGNILWNTNNLWIGKEVGAPLYFNGSFDDIMVFNRSMTATEIQGIYANQTSKNIYVEYAVGSGYYNYTSWAQDTAGNTNQTVNETTVTGDTCTYSSGNWTVLCTDNCKITSNVNLADNDLILKGSGYFSLLANITNVKRTHINSGCQIIIYGGQRLG
jgi:hypothetical protein